MHLCTGQAQEAFRHLATQTEHLFTWEPEHHNTAVTFFAGLLLLNASLLSSHLFLHDQLHLQSLDLSVMEVPMLRPLMLSTAAQQVGQRSMKIATVHWAGQVVQ